MDKDGGSLVLATGDFDMALMVPDNPLADGHPQTNTVAHLFGCKKGIKYLGDGVIIDPRTVVLDADDRIILKIAFSGVGSDLDDGIGILAALGNGIDGVADHIAENLDQAAGLGRHRRQLGVCFLYGNRFFISIAQ